MFMCCCFCCCLLLKKIEKQNMILYSTAICYIGYMLTDKGTNKNVKQQSKPYAIEQQFQADTVSQTGDH